MNKTKIFILFVSIFSFLFASCTPVSTDEREDEGAFENALREAARERRLKLPLSDKDFEKLPIELQEFELTYELLDLFYLYAHMKSELGGRNDYFEQSAGTPYAKLPFGDIYFMFSQMSCNRITSSNLVLSAQCNQQGRCRTAWCGIFCMRARRPDTKSGIVFGKTGEKELSLSC